MRTGPLRRGKTIIALILDCLWLEEVSRDDLLPHPDDGDSAEEP